MSDGTTVASDTLYSSVGDWILRYRNDCRVCGSEDLSSLLDLGKQPLANAYVTGEQLDACLPDERYPLHLKRCNRCSHCQLSCVINPEILYADYKYKSGASEGWKRHAEELAMEIVKERPDATVFDIGSNDGTLLSYCQYHGCRVLGIDPSGSAEGVATLKKFWSPETAKQVRTFPGRADYIVAQNVFGHVDDARGFMDGLALALRPDGVAIIECPWIVSMIRRNQWDTIYHEHLSYWGINPLMQLAEDAGLILYNVRHFPEIHGGTMRYYLRHKPSASSDWVYGMARQEAMLAWPGEDPYGAFTMFGINYNTTMAHWKTVFQTDRSLAGYGASAKFNTFLNAFSDRPPLVGIFDDCPDKIDLFTPGHHFPILKPSPDTMKAVDLLIIGSPNWKDELEKKARALGFVGEVKTLWE